MYKCPKLHIIHIAKEEIEATKPDLNEAFDGISVLRGTVDVHIETVSGSYRIVVKDNAKSAQSMHHRLKNRMRTSPAVASPVVRN